MKKLGRPFPAVPWPWVALGYPSSKSDFVSDTSALIFLQLASLLRGLFYERKAQLPILNKDELKKGLESK